MSLKELIHLAISAQADAMTVEECEAFRKHVTSELAAASVECGHNIMWQFSQTELAAAGTFCSFLLPWYETAVLTGHV